MIETNGSTGQGETVSRRNSVRAFDAATPVLAQRIDVSDWEVLRVEQGGSTPIVWLQQPDTSTSWLHKDSKIPSTGLQQGEDWAEVVATQVAILLGVPCAETRLCTRNGRLGSLSRSVKLPGYDLNDGSVILEVTGASGYYPHREGAKAVDAARPEVRRPGHNLANIRLALTGVLAPQVFVGPAEFSGFDVFAGYLVLDALVANQDRHEQNWAVLTPQLTEWQPQLAPSYDHGGSLGYQLTDSKREYRLRSYSLLEEWAMKGRAHRFEHVPPAATLVDHAAVAVAMCSEQAAQWWKNQLANVDLGPLHQDLSTGVPGMSVAAATFTSKLLDLNLRRLQDAICSGSRP